MAIVCEIHVHVASYYTVTIHYYLYVRDWRHLIHYVMVILYNYIGHTCNCAELSEFLLKSQWFVRASLDLVVSR